MSNNSEKYLTLKEAAGNLGVPYYKVQRAAKRCEIPTYRLHNSRPLVLVSEIVDVMKKSSNKGGK